ncbi:Phosphofructokinase [Artemisia annua]|uniref:Phosphofructokinase n=1 Tax=Artemisia annua TaxID=35608 RepID=A0A2U1MZ58_ARTAN|nr:Phosphofructokinase [Artemisia annua]
MVIVVVEGPGQELLAAETLKTSTAQDASGNKLLQDVGLWISNKIMALLRNMAR